MERKWLKYSETASIHGDCYFQGSEWEESAATGEEGVISGFRKSAVDDFSSNYGSMQPNSKFKKVLGRPPMFGSYRNYWMKELYLQTVRNPFFNGCSRMPVNLRTTPLGVLGKKIWKGQKRSFAILFVYKLGLYIIYYI